MVSGGVFWIEGNGFPELAFRPRPVPIVTVLDHCEGSVGLREGRIELQRLGGSLLGLGKGFLGRKTAVMAPHQEAIRDADVTPCEVRIFGDGLSEVVQSFPFAFRIAFAPPITAPQISV